MNMRRLTVGPFGNRMDLFKYKNDYHGCVILIPEKMRTLIRRVLAAKGSLDGVSGHLNLLHGSTLEMGPNLTSRRSLPPIRVPKGLRLEVRLDPDLVGKETVWGTRVDDPNPDLWGQELQAWAKAGEGTR